MLLQLICFLLGISEICNAGFHRQSTELETALYFGQELYNYGTEISVHQSSKHDNCSYNDIIYGLGANRAHTKAQKKMQQTERKQVRSSHYD